MAAVRMYVDKFGAEVLIDEDHPLAVAQRAKGEAPSSTDQLPASYQAKHFGGGIYRALVDGKPLIDVATGTEAGFKGKDAAITALREFAAGSTRYTLA